jgi:hypothetical protein
LERVRGPELRLLQGEPNVLGFAQFGSDHISLVSYDHRDRVGRDDGCRLQDAINHRSPSDLVENLGKTRLHSSSLAGGQDDYVCSLCSYFRQLPDHWPIAAVHPATIGH